MSKPYSISSNSTGRRDRLNPLKETGQDSTKSDQQTNLPTTATPLFFYFTLQDPGEQNFGLKKLPINNQVLFRDLQLMLTNGFISPVYWNETIENQIIQKIEQLLDEQKNPNIMLSDLYFNDVSSLKLSIIQYGVQSEKQKNHHNIIEQLKFFGNSIKKKNKIQQKKQEGFIPLKNLLDEAVKVYKKIKMQQIYIEGSIEEQIQKRYVIDQILLQSQSLESQNKEFTYNNEEEARQYIKKYQFFLLNQLSNLQAGQFYLNFILGRSLEELKNQFSFYEENLTPFSIKDGLVLQLTNIEQFKIKTIEFMNQNCWNQKEQNLDYPLYFQAVSTTIEEQYLFQTTSEHDHHLFTYLSEMKKQIQNISTFQQPLDELKGFVSETILNICQDLQIMKEDFENPENNILTSVLSEKVAFDLFKDFNFIPDKSSFQKGEAFYQYVQDSFLKEIFFRYIGLYMGLFCTIVQEKQDNVIQLCSKLVTQVRNKALSISEAIISLFRFIEKENINVIDKQCQSPFFEKVQQNLPKILKSYFNISFGGKNLKEEEFLVHVNKQNTQFQEQLTIYENYLENLIVQKREHLNQEIQQNRVSKDFLPLSQTLFSKIKLELLEYFVPYMKIDQLINKPFFSINIQEFLEQKVHSALIGFNQYISYSSQILKDFSEQNRKSPKPLLNQLETEKILKELQQEMQNQMLADQSFLLSSNDQSLILKKISNDLRKKTNELYKKILPERIAREKENLKIQKTNELNFISQSFQKSLIPFECIEIKIYHLIWKRQTEDKDIYLEKLKKLESSISQNNKKLARYLNFAQNNQNIFDLKTYIRNQMIIYFKERDVDSLDEQHLIQQIEEWLKNTINSEEDEKLIKIIGEMQKQYIEQYQAEIFQITQEQCKLILKPQIELQRVKVDQFSELSNKLKKIQEKVQNQQQLETETFQFFKQEILQLILKNYEEQIYNQLEKVDKQDQNISM